MKKIRKSQTAAAPSIVLPAKSAKAAPAPALPVTTVITAKIDVGFGNTLYLRGDGPGLTWNKGIPLDCVGDALWTITLTGGGRPITFKFLLNDKKWSVGEDYLTEPGSRPAYTPAF